jgi:hypothetical protein
MSCSLTSSCLPNDASNVPTCMVTFALKRLASKRLHIVLAVAWVQTSKAASRLLVYGVSELKVLLP